MTDCPMSKTTTKMTTNELSEEVVARKESELWDLPPCPCCKAKARVFERANDVVILCSQFECRVVEGKTLADAAFLWRQPRFTDK